jgi:hypothetical protein
VSGSGSRRPGARHPAPATAGTTITGAGVAARTANGRAAGNAVRADLTAQAAHQHVWRPDAVGSVCFLVASTLAWFEAGHGWAGT